MALLALAKTYVSSAVVRNCSIFKYKCCAVTVGGLNSNVVVCCCCCFGLVNSCSGSCSQSSSSLCGWSAGIGPLASKDELVVDTDDEYTRARTTSSKGSSVLKLVVLVLLPPAVAGRVTIPVAATSLLLLLLLLVNDGGL